MAQDEPVQDAVALFSEHYRNQFGDDETMVMQNNGRVTATNPLLKKDNGPVLLVHDQKTSDAVVLIHGLTDSPYYMSAIGQRFFKAGVNVVLPLLPAHGLKDPDAAMEDEHLAKRWKDEVDLAVNIARRLGQRVSIGGLSTGGALSVNKTLRDSNEITGGIFLFSAALDVGLVNEMAGKSRLIVPMITKHQDGEYRGIGANPYKYPKFSQAGAYQLIQVIHENRKLSKNIELFQPVFAAHSIHDTSAQIKGIVDFFTIHKGNRLALVISENPPVSHAEVVLEKDIVMDESQPDAETATARANPNFNGMMTVALGFFEEYIQNRQGGDK